MKTEKQSAATVAATGQTKSAGTAAYSPASHKANNGPGRPPHTSTKGRRSVIVAGSVSLVTLAAGGLLSAALPTPSRLPNGAASTAAKLPLAESLPEAIYTLVPMSSQEYAGFRPTLTAGLTSTNQEPSSRCPEAIARLSLMATPQSQGQVRITSGTYTTPWFLLAEGPATFVIPFPAPYESGKGVLKIEGNPQRGVLSLSPGMELNSSTATTVSIPVFWAVNANCR